MTILTVSILLLALVSRSYAAELHGRRNSSESPVVTLDNGTFVGVSQGSVNVFRGIPYALPPDCSVDDLRFSLPVANDPYSGTYNATAFGASCIQQVPNVDLTGLNPTAASILQGLIKGGNTADDEDCLTMNVYAPANATADSMLPVAFWIYGGGFEQGTTAQYNGSVIVERSLQLEKPTVYVSVNYRLSALGFSGSAEVREAGIGNLGLQDQRLGLQWVQKYISAFGGDPSKVTIWGESAGAVSVASHIIASNGNTEGLFRGGFMQSGSHLPTGEVEDGQVYFDQFASDAGCAESLGSTAVFDCLRNASSTAIRAAMNASPDLFGYQGLSLAWVPRADGVFFTAPATQLILNGSIPDIPIVTGDCDDEGTIFGLASSNITTEGELQEYLQEYFFASANDSVVNSVLDLYSAEPSEGSPFGTGNSSAITPQFKRIAAIMGDLAFQAPRRFFLSHRSGNSSAFVFLSQKGKTTPVLGSYHTSDIANVYGFGELTDAVVNFVADLDPNGGVLVDWPEWNNDTRTMLAITDAGQQLINDTYRAEGMNVLTETSLVYPL